MHVNVGEFFLPFLAQRVTWFILISFFFSRCLLLVLESSRVEVAVLLNELAYLKYETSNNSSSNAEIISLKQRNLAIAFSLVEKTIKLISNVVEDEGTFVFPSLANM